MCKASTDPPLLLPPDFVVQELPRTDGAQDAAPEAVALAVQVRGRLGGQASEQHAAEKAGPGHSWYEYVKTENTENTTFPNSPFTF